MGMRQGIDVKGRPMAEDIRRETGDFIDDLIGIRNDLRAIQHPFDSMNGEKTAAETKPWEPSKYKERPKGTAQRCIRIAAGDESVCSACLDVCPTNAITIGADSIQISDVCRKCGLCLTACPTDAISDRHHLPKGIHDEVAKAATAYEHCYITCTRALGHAPEPNEVVMPCVGVVPPETLFALLTEFPNISVYLPFGICDKCRTTTGEQVFTESIALAERWSGRNVGLEMDEDALDFTVRHSYERTQFVSEMLGGSASLLGGKRLSAAQTVAKTISENTARLNAIDRQLDQMVGGTNSAKRRRTLPRRRKLLLGALQKHPELAENVSYEVPVCDSTKCTMCGACGKVCPFNACDVDTSGHFNLADVYCIGCGACVAVCEDGALTMQPGDPSDLLVPDEETAKREEQKAKQKAEIERLKAEGKKNAKKALDFLESLDTEDSTTDA